jgi:hypothetical protein
MRILYQTNPGMSNVDAQLSGLNQRFLKSFLKRRDAEVAEKEECVPHALAFL